MLAGTRLLFEGGLLGYSGGELYVHAWVQWWHALALPAWPPGTELARGATSWPVIDPLPTLIASGLGRVFGWTAGWNLWILISIGLAFAGGAALARREGGDPVVGGAALAAAPALLGSLSSGLSEDGALGLLALAIAALRGQRTRTILAGGALLGGVAWCGLYLAFMGALAAVGIGLAACLRAPRRAPAFVGAAALSGLVASPALQAFSDRIAGEGHRAGEVAARVEPLWRLNPWRGADLLSFFAPGRVALTDELVRLHPVYLGWVALGLAAWGLARWLTARRAARAEERAAGRGALLGWWILVPCLLLAPGRELSLAGDPLGIENPVWRLLSLIPGAAQMNHHARWMLLGGLGLSLAAAAGAAGIRGRLRRWIAPLILLETALLSPAPLPLPVTPAGWDPALGALAPGGALAAAMEPGGGDGAPLAVLTVPVAGPGVHFQRPLFEQRAHGRPVASSPNRPGEILGGGTALGRWLVGASWPNPPPAPADPSAAEAELRASGVGAIYARSGLRDRIEALLGPPELRGDAGSIWILEGG